MPADEPTPKQPSDRDDALAVLRRIREAGHEAYFAGGCVRDLLLGLPAKDYDVATDAPPARVRELFNNTQAVGAAFGVILVRQRKSMIEVATFRTDGDYTDGRRPDSVRFSTAEEDAQRRDFTINGLFLDPLEAAPTAAGAAARSTSAGRVIDYVGGQADLAAKTVRAIGDPAARFAEDYLRMLRAVRFAARLGFEIEPATAAAIRTQAKCITLVSPERIADELRRMLTPPTRGRAWALLKSTGLLPLLFRGVAGSTDTAGWLANTDPHAAMHFPLSLAVALCDFHLHAGPAADPGASWIAENVRKVRALFRLSNEERDALDAILKDAAGLLEGAWSRARRMRFMAADTAGDCRALLRVLAANGWAVDRIAAIEANLKPLEGVDCRPTPWVTGDDLVAAGLSPGPRFKKVLDEVYDAQLESRVADQAAAMALAMSLAQTK